MLNGNIGLLQWMYATGNNILGLGVYRIYKSCLRSREHNQRLRDNAFDEF